MLSKMELRLQMDAKSGQLKNEGNSEIFSTFDDAQDSANGTAIIASEVCSMMILHLEFQLKMHLKIYIKIHKNVHLW